MSRKLSLFFIPALILIAWLIFSALRPGIETYIIEGKLDVINGSPNEAVIYFTQEKGIPENLDELNKAVVRRSGTFATKFNGIPHKPAYLHVRKEGYTPIRATIVLDAPDKIEKLNDALLITSLPYSETYNEFTASKEKLFVVAFNDECLEQEKGRSPLHQVDFFEGLSLASGQCAKGKQNIFKAQLCITGHLSNRPSYFSIIHSALTSRDSKVLTYDR